MIFASPFPYGYDSQPYYYQPAYQQPSPSYYNQRRYLQQLRAEEEAKRRAEAQRYQRMQAAREDYIRRLQEEEAYRQAYEEAKRRRQIEEAKQLQQYLYGSDVEFDGKSEEAEDEEVTEPIFRVMQGPDGQLYKVKIGEKARPEPKLRRRSSQSKSFVPPPSEDTYQLMRGPDGRIYSIKLQQQTKNKEEKPMPTTPMSTRADVDYRKSPPAFSKSAEESSSLVDEEIVSPRKIPIQKSTSILQERSTSGKDKRKQKVSVLVVEDASDSESEDDYKSVWRNRRPSPGQWMEPIQSSWQTSQTGTVWILPVMSTWWIAKLVHRDKPTATLPSLGTSRSITLIFLSTSSLLRNFACSVCIPTTSTSRSVTTLSTSVLRTTIQAHGNERLLRKPRTSFLHGKQRISS